MLFRLAARFLDAPGALGDLLLELLEPVPQLPGGGIVVPVGGAAERVLGRVPLARQPAQLPLEPEHVSARGRPRTRGAACEPKLGPSPPDPADGPLPRSRRGQAPRRHRVEAEQEQGEDEQDGPDRPVARREERDRRREQQPAGAEQPERWDPPEEPRLNTLKLDAGFLMALLSLTGAMIRPIGGLIADRLSGVKVLLVLLIAISLCNFAFATLMPPLAGGVALLVALYFCFGLGNGATFQLVPHRWKGKTGIMTGIIGAAGGIGGFYLPVVMGIAKESTGSYQLGFATFGVLAAVAFVLVATLQRQWLTWALPSATSVAMDA